MKITPTNGTRQFRRSYMGVEGDAVVVGDRKGVSRRFPMKQGPESPADFLSVMAEPMGAFRSQALILDGKGEALAISHVGDWDSVELEEFIAAAGLTQRVESSRRRWKTFAMTASSWRTEPGSSGSQPPGL